MPCGTSRWHGLSFQKPSRARKMNEDTVCGALSPYSSSPMSPQLVASVAFHTESSAMFWLGTSSKLGTDDGSGGGEVHSPGAGDSWAGSEGLASGDVGVGSGAVDSGAVATGAPSPSPPSS